MEAPTIPNGLLPSDMWPCLELIGSLISVGAQSLFPRFNSYGGLSISPATRLLFSQRKLHDGEYMIFLCKVSLAVRQGTVRSLEATQQADPMILSHATILSDHHSLLVVHQV